MEFDVSNFKVVYDEKVLNAISALAIYADGNFPEPGKIVKPKELQVVAINEDGNIIVIVDESWRFQFIPHLRGDKGR